MLMVAGTICGLLIMSGASLFVLAAVDPALDTSAAFGALRDAIGTLVGLAAGYVAGRFRRPE